MSVENNGWLPIETAPRDGTHFLAYAKDFTWDDWLDVDGGIFECYVEGDGRFVSQRYEFGEFCISDQPTHWMPLPEPPQ